MSLRTGIALILASLAFGFVLGWVTAKGRRTLDRPSPGELAQQMAPGMNSGQSSGMAATPAPSSTPMQSQGQQNAQAIMNRITQLEQDVQGSAKTNVNSWLELARLYATVGQYQKSESAYAHVVELDPSEKNRAEYAYMLLQNEKVQEAEKIVNDLLAKNPDQPEGLFLKGTILGMFYKDREKAIEYYERFLQLYPDHPMANFVHQFLPTMKARLQQDSQASQNQSTQGQQ